jgi:hypothetical protein
MLAVVDSYQYAMPYRPVRLEISSTIIPLTDRLKEVMDHLS